MEKSTTLGMTLGLFAVGYGMYLKGADPHALINPAAFLIIFAGTFAALLNAFPMKDIKRFGKLLKIIFTGKKITSKQEILELFVSLAKSAKSEGVMGIEKKANEVEDPFIRSTLILVADGFQITADGFFHKVQLVKISVIKPEGQAEKFEPRR